MSSPGSSCGHGQVTCQARPGTPKRDQFHREGVWPPSKHTGRPYQSPSVCRGHLAPGPSRNTKLIFVSTSQATRDLTTHSDSGMTEVDCLSLQPSKISVSDCWARCPASPHAPQAIQTPAAFTHLEPGLELASPAGKGQRGWKAPWVCPETSACVPLAQTQPHSPT